MFLIITEDGEILKTKDVTNEDLRACESGIISIINLNQEIPTEYYLGQWELIDDM